MVRLRSVGVVMSHYALILSCKSLVLFTFLVAFPGPAAAEARASEAYGQLQLHFEANQGQAHEDVRFLARGPGYSLYLTAGDAVLALAGSKPVVLRMVIMNADPKPLVSGIGKLPGKANYFIGNDPAKWRTNVPTYAKVHYRSVYPGVDLIYYGNQRQLEYDFVVAPGADPKTIALGFQGADKLEIDAQGDLVLHTPGGSIHQRKPFIYQEIDGERLAIDGSYVIKGRNRVGFQVAAYDSSRPLVIDPVMVYSTYLGGSNEDVANDIAVDAAGNAYVTGSTLSSDFPTTPGAFDPTYNGDHDVFVSKLDSTGATLVYSTYLGGSSRDVGTGIVLDSGGNAYVTGYTHSSDFPTTPAAFDRSHNGDRDVFVTKIDATGATLAYSTYLGGRGEDTGASVAVDTGGNAHVAGLTNSSNFPTTPAAFDPTFNGSIDVFVTKLDATGSTLVYSTFLGGSSEDHGTGVAVDFGGNAYVTGRTASPDYPTTPGAFDMSHNGGFDAFVTKLNSTGTTLVYSTFLGGSSEDFGRRVAIDSFGSAYVAGETTSGDFPVTPGAFDTSHNGGFDAFVTKLDPAGAALVYSTYLGGNGHDSGLGIAVDTARSAYVTGLTASLDFPTTSGAFDPSQNGDFDAFLVKLDATGATLVYSTFLGGSNADVGSGVAVDASGNAYVVGYTASTDFPTTPGAFDRSHNGNFDAFVVKIADLVEIPRAVVLIIDEESIDNGNPPNFFSRRDVNDDVAEIGVRAQLRFFRENVGRTIILHTGQVGDEGWFALKKVPESWAPAGGLAGYIGNPGANPEDPPPHGTGPGLGAPDANGDRESLLDNVPEVTPLRATGLKNLEGRDACAVVYDSNISINYGPLTGSLKGANLGTVAFKVLSVTPLTGYSSSSLPQVQIMILDAREACRRALLLLTDSLAPAPTSMFEPFDVMP
jgi:hypothetical protein